MFHATFMMIHTCFVHTLCHYYAFSGTNLLTRCRSASCYFLLFLVSEILQRKYSRNWTKSTPSILFFPGRPHTWWRRGQGGARPLWSGSTRTPPRLPFRLLKASVAKTLKESHDTRKVPEPPPSRSQDSGDRSLCSGTPPGRGIAPGRHLHRHHRHLHRRCCLL